jgi:hypothetical protein
LQSNCDDKKEYRRTNNVDELKIELIPINPKLHKIAMEDIKNYLVQKDIEWRRL